MKYVDGLEMKLGEGQYTAVSESSFDQSISANIDQLAVGESLIVKFRMGATDIQPAGKETSFTIYSRAAKPSSVTYDPLTLTMKGVASTMEYKGPADTAWKSISASTVNLESYVSSSADIPIQIRVKATITASASEAVTVVMPKAIQTIAGNLDYTKELINGLEAGVAYEYRTSSSWVAVTNTNGTFSVASLIPTASDTTLYLRKKATSTTAPGESKVYVLTKRPAAPAGVTMIYNDPSNPDKGVMTGLSSALEYKLSSAAQWATPLDKVVFDIPGSAQAYYVRTKATDTSFASVNATVRLLSRGSALSSTYNASEEYFTLNSSMEWSFDGGMYKPVDEGVTKFVMSEKIDALAAGQKLTVSIRTKATENAPANTPTTTVIYPRLAAPTTVTYDSVKFIIRGVSTAMQYKIPADTTWRSISSATILTDSYVSDSSDVTIQVRMKNTAVNSGSKPINVVLPKLVDAPAGTLDYVKEAIVGLDASAVYQYGLSPVGTSWINRTNVSGTVSIADLITATERTIYLRKAATASAPASAAKAYVIPPRPAAVKVPVIVYNNPDYPEMAVISGILPAMEYRSTTATEWISGTGEDLICEVTKSTQPYYVRLKGTNSTFASVNTGFGVMARGTAIAYSYNASDEILTITSDKFEVMEWSLDGSPYSSVPFTSLKYNVADRIDTLQKGQKLEIRIRYKAAATTPATFPYVLILYPRADAPTTVTYEAPSFMIKGVTTSMQYRLSTDAAWKAFTATSMSAEQYASATKDVSILVRLAATSASAASKPVTVVIPKLADAPVFGPLNYAEESITGMDPGVTYQGKLSGSPAMDLTNENGAIDISTFISFTEDRTVYLRKAATAQEPYSAWVMYQLPKRPSITGLTSKFVYNDLRYPDKAVLTQVDTNIQYRMDGDTEWKSVGNDPVVVDIPLSSINYHVRWKGTETEFPSMYIYVALYTRSAYVPSINYNFSTEIISSLNSSTMEWSFGGEPYQAIPENMTTYSVSKDVDSLAAGQTLVINVRNKAKETNPASLPKTITLYPRSKVPATVAFDSTTKKLTGVSTSMEYRKQGTSTWTAFSYTALDVSSFLKTEKEVMLEVRNRNTSTNSCSKPVLVRIYTV